MPRERHSYWNGNVRLSLITFPVRLYAAVLQKEKIRLHKLERGTGERIHYQNVTDDGDIVEPEDIVKGYEYEKGQYVEIDDNELKKLRVESSHMLDIVQFTDIRNIDPIYFDRPYYMVPDTKLAHEAFITLRDALRSSKKVALGQITLSGKERIAAIKPACNGLVVETPRYEYEVR
jgi:DNA end-binding protein Ku